MGGAPPKQNPGAPHFYDPADDELTKVTGTDELVGESARPAPEERTSGEAGLRQMFSRDPARIREQLPTEAEGDALLDLLFDPNKPNSPDPPPAGTGRRPPLPPRASGAPRPPGPLGPPGPPSTRTSGLPSARVSAPPPLPRGARPPVPPSRPGAGRPTTGRMAAAPSRPGAPPPPPSRPGPPPSRPGPPPVPGARPMPPNRTELPAVDFDEETRVVSAPPLPMRDETASDVDGRAMMISTSDLETSDGSNLEPMFDEPTHVAEPSEAAPAELTGPLPTRDLPAGGFGHEQDASSTLVDQDQRDGWVDRAAWLRAEAESLDSRAARARALLVSSELYAMAGEDATAAEVAREARDLAPTSAMSNRQVRGLAMREGNWRLALQVLEHETKVAPSAEARCHGGLLAAAILSQRFRQPELAAKGLQFAARSLASDPRAYVQRIGDALSMPDAPATAPGVLAKLRLPEGSGLEVLGEAAEQLSGQLSPSPHRSSRPATSPHEALTRARSALDAGDAPTAVRELAPLARVEGLAAPVAWLTAALASPRKETRGLAVEALRQVVNGPHSAFACRALAARAIEIGDAGAAAAATEAAAQGGFAAADRIALAALAGGTGAASAEDVQAWIQASAYDEDLSPLAAAASGAMTDPADPDRRVMHVGSASSRAGASLGRMLAAVAASDTGGPGGLMANEQLVSAVAGYGDLAEGGGVARALALELDVDAAAVTRVAHSISTWSSAETESERDRALAGALLAEAAGERERALGDYDRARDADGTHEGAARARASHGDQASAARILAAHAEALEPGVRAAVLLTEAAVRIADVDAADQAEPLLKRAADLGPTLPLAVHLGERAARVRGDRDALVDWLRKRREASDDPIEQAHDLVREALLLSDSEGTPAAALLEQALRARPSDIGLRELYERLSGEPPADFATWRAQRAAEAMARADGPDVEAARLALEASLDFERSGDLERAAAAARDAMAAGDQLLAPIAVYRAALAGHGTGELIDAMLPRAREATDTLDRLEIYERLADLDEIGRKDTASGLLWRRTILEDTPSHLPTLRRVASALIESGRDDELEPIAFEIAKALEGAESAAHALVCARIRLRNIGWDETHDPVEIAYRAQPRGIWALRQTAAHARARGEHALAVEADRQLLERTDRPAEAATLSLRAAEAALKSGDADTARALLQSAVESVPQHPTAHGLLAKVLEQGGDAAGAANAYEMSAAASNVPTQRLRDLYQAQKLWLDTVKDNGRARAALENIAAIDPSYQDVFQRLQSIYVAEGSRAELAGLLRRRLDAVTDPAERVEMEVLRGRALAEVGETAAAKHALSAALETSPDHVEALTAFAELCATEGDFAGAEQSYIRLARLIADADRQAEIYLRLGQLYDEHLPNAERAELAYREILKRSANDSAAADGARERLVRLYRKANDPARAIEEQTVLITSAQAPEGKCKRTCELAEIYEGTGDLKKAEATLLNARKTWPKDEVALASLVRFYQRTGQAPAAQVLLDRAVADARRALGTGRFEPFLFSTIATVADLRGRPDAARIAHATVAALEGKPTNVEGAGNHAGDARLDDLLAPEVMTPAFRELLQKTGPLLDVAVPFDLSSIRAQPLPSGLADLGEHVRLVAQAYGLNGVNVHFSSALGSVCVAAAAHPPTVVLGEPLLSTSRTDVRTFLLHRALKVVQSNTSAFSRTAPIDLWPLLAAYVKAFAPTWSPVGVDAAKFADAFGRISRALQGLRIDPQVGILAADVIGSIGNRASMLNTVVNGWGDRAGLLALGDPNVAITGVAWAGGHVNAPPSSGKERLTWIGRNAEARDLIVFSVSDTYADARGRLGLDRR
jgi:tetratricopeptide (TPR) repeat protein